MIFEYKFYQQSAFITNFLARFTIIFLYSLKINPQKLKTPFDFSYRVKFLYFSLFTKQRFSFIIIDKIIHRLFKKIFAKAKLYRKRTRTRITRKRKSIDRSRPTLEQPLLHFQLRFHLQSFASSSLKFIYSTLPFPLPATNSNSSV